MEFKKWFEMASFIVSPGEVTIPCNKLHVKDCVSKSISGIDMKFEFYPPPYNRLNNGSKFAAQIPGSSQFLIYHGGSRKEIMAGRDALKLGYLPFKENKVDKTPGAVSSQGYYLIPNDWYLHATLLDDKDELVQ